jgi:hypothetical protein
MPWGREFDVIMHGDAFDYGPMQLRALDIVRLNQGAVRGN